VRALVIGVTGMLGARVRDRVAAEGIEVVTAARSTRAASPVHGWVGHRRMDLATDGVGAIAAAIADIAPDVVLNCAGRTHGTAHEFAAANVTGTAALVQALIRVDQPIRLVHLGSSAEYGLVEPGVPVAEDTAPMPVGLYGATKLAGTCLVRTARAAGLDAVVLRVFNAVGAGMPMNSLPGRVAAQLRTALRGGGEVRLGPLDAVRDFIDVRDIADAALAAVLAPALPNPVLNIASGVATPVRDLVKELIAISGWSGTVHEDGGGSARSADVPWIRADVTLASRDLRWRPRRDLTTSLESLWETVR